MGQLGLYAPGIMGLMFAAVVFFYVRHLVANRPETEPTTQTEEAQDILPFDELKTNEEIRAQLRANQLYERQHEHH